MLENLINTLAHQDIFEWIGLITGIIYVILAAREKPVCWVFGIVSCAMIAYKDLTSYLLYSDAGLQIFYIIMGVFGLYQWLRKNDQGNDTIRIKRMRRLDHLLMFAGSIVLSFPVGYLFNRYTDASFSYLDAWTTVLSIGATILLIRKYLENWIYWIFIDLVYVYLYFQRGADFFALLFLIYGVIAIYGLKNWRKNYLD